MKKRWTDIDNVISSYGVEGRLKTYDYMMKEVPNSNHYKVHDNSNVVYSKNEFMIIKTCSNNRIGYILYNSNKPWRDGHTHLISFEIAKTVISNIINKKKPKTSNLYLLQSHIRVSDDIGYIDYIENLIEVKKRKTKQNYRNKR